jgi:hypothetical protein
MEHTTVTSGTPAGCSVGDTSATLAPYGGSGATIASTISPQDGSNAFYLDSGADNVQFSIASNDLFSLSAGTITFYVYISTFQVNMELFTVGFDASNGIKLMLYQTEQITATWAGGGTPVTLYSLTGLTTGSWHKVQFSYRTGASDPSIWVAIDDASPTGTAISNTDLAEMTGSNGKIYIGSLNTGTYVAAIDNLRITNAYTAAP